MLLFSEILVNRGYHEEVFDIIIHTQDSLRDPHILRVLADIFATADWSSDETTNRLKALDACSVLEYENNSFLELL